MKNVLDTADRRQGSWCVHCGTWLSEVITNRDHVPSKVMLDNPYPSNLALIKVCQPCNSSFAWDEEYFAAFLSAALSGSTEPEMQASIVIGGPSGHFLRTRIARLNISNDFSR
jgi:hypothetical protein